MENNDKLNNEEPILKICKICHTTKDINCFRRNRYGSYDDICNECTIIRRKERKIKEIKEIIDKSLPRFSDRELINELQSRGYIIVSMKLIIEKVAKEVKPINLE